jgi:hypothetical protein
VLERRESPPRRGAQEAGWLAVGCVVRGAWCVVRSAWCVGKLSGSRCSRVGGCPGMCACSGGGRLLFRENVWSWDAFGEAVGISLQRLRLAPSPSRGRPSCSPSATHRLAVNAASRWIATRARCAAASPRDASACSDSVMPLPVHRDPAVRPRRRPDHSHVASLRQHAHRCDVIPTHCLRSAVRAASP